MTNRGTATLYTTAPQTSQQICVLGLHGDECYKYICANILARPLLEKQNTNLQIRVWLKHSTSHRKNKVNQYLIFIFNILFLFPWQWLWCRKTSSLVRKDKVLQVCPTIIKIDNRLTGFDITLLRVRDSLRFLETLEWGRLILSGITPFLQGCKSSSIVLRIDKRKKRPITNV